MTLPNRSFWSQRTVFLTGHTGFKGSWLSLWLSMLGARVYGFSLDPPTQPSLFEAAGLAQHMHSLHGDVRDQDHLRASLGNSEADVVIHMAAQSLVLPSYEDPLGTLETNIMGTARVLECARHSPGVRAVLVVTSDKCYAPPVPTGGYAESAPMGGDDPYSASKGCAELVTHCYRKSFPGGGAIASARAGNVIGGGDWAQRRLVPDLVQALQRGVPLEIRYPQATRPWQHVLDPLAGYLALLERLWHEPDLFARGWNLGPDSQQVRSVGEVVAQVERHWGGSCALQAGHSVPRAEAARLQLDVSQASQRLDWHPRLDFETAISWTVNWYRAFYAGGQAYALSAADIFRYQNMSGMSTISGAP